MKVQYRDITRDGRTFREFKYTHEGRTETYQKEYLGKWTRSNQTEAESDIKKKIAKNLVEKLAKERADGLKLEVSGDWEDNLR